MVAKPAELAMKVGPDVPVDAPRPLVADEAHYRDHGGGRYTLYTVGAHIPAGHADLPVVPAVADGGVWRPKPKPPRKTARGMVA